MRVSKPPDPDVVSKLDHIILQLPECDQLRLLRFGEAMLVQRAGKRQRRSARFHRKPVESWQIGQ